MEQEIKAQMALRPKTDHFQIDMGSAAKGTKIALKCYYDVLNIDDAQNRIENLLKIHTWLKGKGYIQQ